MKLSEQIRELSSGVRNAHGGGYDYNHGWGQALEKAAELVEQLEDTGIIERGRAVMCAYCNRAFFEYPSNEPTSSEHEAALKTFAAHDAACERNPLAARVRELEARLRFTAESLRSLSPGPHAGPMDAEDYVPLVARLIESLQSQLAWTPVAQGLPTVPGYYLFEHSDAGLTLYELVDSELYPWRNVAGARRKSEAMSRLYEQFRRIELPEAV